MYPVYPYISCVPNGNRTYVGSACIKNIDQRVDRVIAYFHYILTHPIEGTFVGTTESGLQLFGVLSNTKLVTGSEKIVNHLNPQVIKNEGGKWGTLVKHLNPQMMRNLEGKWGVLVKYSKPETLIPKHDYELKLKANYVRGQLTFTAV